MTLEHQVLVLALLAEVLARVIVLSVVLVACVLMGGVTLLALVQPYLFSCLLLRDYLFNVSATIHGHSVAGNCCSTGINKEQNCQDCV